MLTHQDLENAQAPHGLNQSPTSKLAELWFYGLELAANPG
jgi:hypothetical protein